MSCEASEKYLNEEAALQDPRSSDNCPCPLCKACFNSFKVNGEDPKTFPLILLHGVNHIFPCNKGNTGSLITYESPWIKGHTLCLEISESNPCTWSSFGEGRWE